MAAIIDKAKEMLQGIFTGSDGVNEDEKFINTPEQQTFYNNIMQDYTVFKANRQTVDPWLQMEQRFYDGDHWYGLRPEHVSRMRPNSKDNIAWSQIEAIVGKLSGWDPWPDFQAKEENDEQKAKDLNAFIPYELKQINFKEKYVDAIRQCVVHGPLLFKVIYDPNVEGGRGQNRYVGQNDIIPLDIGTVFTDPRITNFIYLQEMGAIIINTRKTLEYFQRKWPGQGHKVQQDNTAQDTQIYSYPNYAMAMHTFNYTDGTVFPWDAATQTKTAGLLEYWYRGLPKMMTDEDKALFKEQAESKLGEGKDPSECLAKANGSMEGVHCVYVSTSGVFLEHKSYVYDHGKYPFVGRTLFPNKRNVWGKGFMRDMISPQTMLNKFSEIAVMTMAKQGNAAIAYESGAIAKPNQWKEQRSTEGAMLEIAPGRMSDWKELQGVNVPETVFKMMNYYQEMLQKIPGQFDSANGAPNANVTSGEQAKAMIAAASSRLNTVSDMISEAMSEVFSMYVDLIAQFYTDKRIARVTGQQVSMSRDSLISQAPTDYRTGNMIVDPNTGEEVPEIINVQEEYVPEFDILVNITAEKPLDSQYWIQMAFNMLNMVDPITQLPMVDAEAVRYTIANGRMEPMDVIERRIAAKAGKEQQMQQIMQQNEQLQMQLAGMNQQMAGLASEIDANNRMKLQAEQEQLMFNRQQQERKTQMDELKTLSQIAKDQASIPMGGVPSA